MDGVSKDKLPHMISTAQDGFDDTDEGLADAAGEAYEYILKSKGLILKIFCLKVTPYHVEAAQARREAMGDGIVAELEARFASDFEARNKEFEATVGSMEKAVEEKGTKAKGTEPSTAADNEAQVAADEKAQQAAEE